MRIKCNRSTIWTQTQFEFFSTQFFAQINLNTKLVQNLFPINTTHGVHWITCNNFIMNRGKNNFFSIFRMEWISKSNILRFTWTERPIVSDRKILTDISFYLYMSVLGAVRFKGFENILGSGSDRFEGKWFFSLIFTFSFVKENFSQSYDTQWCVDE